MDDERMDDVTNDGPNEPDAADRVGLGRVVKDHAPATGHSPAPDDVEEASDESFPASDPPAFAPGHAAPRPGTTTGVERPDARDVPGVSGRPSA